MGSLDWESCLIIFFFKQKTAYEMRISDWSSDVCSSDLAEGTAVEGMRAADDAGAVRLAVVEVEAARDLGGTLQRLDAGVAEEHGVGEGIRHQPVGQPLLLGDRKRHV